MLSVCKAVLFRCDCPGRRLSRAIVFVIFCGCLGSLPGGGAEKSEVVKAPSENQRLQQDLKSIRAEVDRLKEENAALKKQNQLLQSENQRLRRLLGNTSSATNADSGAEGESSTGSNEQAAAAKDATTNQAGGAKATVLTHWLSTGDGRRHSGRCRYYKTTPGRPCGPDEGALCTFCGD